MEIVEKHWEEEKLKINETVFVKSKLSMDSLKEAPTPSFLDSLDSLKVPILGSSGAVVLVIILVIVLIAAIKLSKGKDNNGPSVIVQNSAVAAPVVAAATSAPGAEVPPVPQQSYNYNNMNIKDIIKIPVLQRDSFMKDTVARHSQRGKTNSTLHSLA